MLPKPCGAGWYLSGTLSLPKDEFGKRVSQINFVYVIGDLSKKTKSESAISDSVKAEKSVKQKYEGDLFVAIILRFV